jgi:hypothetical protein
MTDTGQIIGTKGFVAWFYAVIYNKVRKACKNIFVKISVHLLGIVLMILGAYFLILTMPSFTSIVGLFLILFGLIVFLIPLGAK